MHTLNGNAFKNLWLPVNRENCDHQITDVIARLYQENGQTEMATMGNSYQRSDLAMLWFLNGTRCQQRMILACFMCKMTFDDRIKYDNCCDNYMSKNTDAEQVPKFNGYDITVRLSKIYKHTIKYLNLLLSSERDRLLTANPIRNPRTTVE